MADFGIFSILKFA